MVFFESSLGLSLGYQYPFASRRLSLTGLTLSKCKIANDIYSRVLHIIEVFSFKLDLQQSEKDHVLSSFIGFPVREPCYFMLLPRFRVSLDDKSPGSLLSALTQRLSASTTVSMEEDSTRLSTMGDVSCERILLEEES